MDFIIMLELVLPKLTPFNHNLNSATFFTFGIQQQPQEHVHPLLEVIFNSKMIFGVEKEHSLLLPNVQNV
jgi:hypothetical protein